MAGTLRVTAGVGVGVRLALPEPVEERHSDVVTDAQAEGTPESVALCEGLCAVEAVGLGEALQQSPSAPTPVRSDPGNSPPGQAMGSADPCGQ